ncbi:FIST signal transduction protein [Candidatus Protochlamydia phocaeensis]|uniref:FIST signal transduction protein n=1 Tax=Candidatus Protochlamydia phocaeensis TaxID=1414722 RepID=UPI000837C8BB|nr:FIST N-terminal domain-containing protein [Candidatus Protochlamydia phocaeensis]
MGTQFATSLVMQEDSFEAGKEAARQAMDKLQKPVKPGLIVIFCADKYDYNAVIRGIKSVTGQVPLIGCSSAGQFSSEGVTKEGIACTIIASDDHQFFAGIGSNIKSHPLETIQHAACNFPKDVEGHPHQAAILLVDGLVGKGEEAVLSACSILGPHVKFAGGAAADNLSFRETAVFGNDQALSDAVSLCLVASRHPLIIATKHGHHPISSPLLVTKAKDIVLYELNNRPAVEVWKDYVREPLRNQGIDIDAISFKELSPYLLEYEFGLMISKDEYKIRFPSSCNADGSLNFVCSILEGAVLKVMDSSKQDLIESARQTAQLALKSAKQTKIAGAIIFDCACRAMVLKDQFPKAVEAMQEVLGSIPFIGCETYGEIAMEAGKFSGFHNTSTVIMLFPS